MMDGGWWMMGGGGLIFLALLVLLVFWFAREPTNGSTGASAGSPEDLLAQRYARGDIDEVEYRHRLDVLQNRDRRV